MVLGMNTGRNGDHRRGNTQGRKERVKDNESAKQDPIPQIMSLPQPKHKVGGVSFYITSAESVPFFSLQLNRYTLPAF